MDIGTAIKLIRKERGLSQKELANKINLSVNALSQIETNNSFPHKSTITKICEIFQIPISYLLMFSLTDEDVSEDRKGIFNTLNKAIKDVLIEEMKKNSA